MIHDRLFGSPIVSALKKGLEGATVRHQAIANNIANVSTPGYKRQEVSFEKELWEALQQAGDGHNNVQARQSLAAVSALQSVRPEIGVDKATSVRIDRNTVDIDREMVEMMKNSGKHAQRAELLNRIYGQIKQAIRGQVA